MFIHCHSYIYRWDMSVDGGAYNGSNMRSLEVMRECRLAKGIHKVKGCVHPPLINVEPEDCVIDELHLFLRITDVLFENLFTELSRLSHRAKTNGTGRSDHVEQAVSAIRGCGVSFNVRPSNEGSRQSRSGMEMTSLNRNEKLKVMTSLTDHFDDLLPPETAASITKLWKDFLVLYRELSSKTPDVESLESKAKEWITYFLSLPSLPGHQKTCVTPYMHVLAYHVPDQVQQHKNIRKFSGQGEF